MGGSVRGFLLAACHVVRYGQASFEQFAIRVNGSDMRNIVGPEDVVIRCSAPSPDVMNGTVVMQRTVLTAVEVSAP
jgi:SOS-response transcriptional repressor LexA